MRAHSVKFPNKLLSILDKGADEVGTAHSAAQAWEQFNDDGIFSGGVIFELFAL